jgi:hypothetical protein
VVSTEDTDTLKVDDQPVVAAETQFTADENKTQGGSEVPKYFGRLPKQTTGDPQIALDLQSTIHALEEQLKIVQAEAEKAKDEAADAKGKLETKEKEGEADSVLDLLSDLEIIEDAKDREQYKAKLGKVPAAAMQVLEEILKDVAATGEGGKSGGGPKKPAAPASKPGGMPPKGGPAAKDGGPVFSSAENVVRASLVPDMDTTTELVSLWLRADRSKELTQV